MRIRGHRVVCCLPYHPQDGPVEFTVNQVCACLTKDWSELHNLVDMRRVIQEIIENDITEIDETCHCCGYIFNQYIYIHTYLIHWWITVNLYEITYPTKIKIKMHCSSCLVVVLPVNRDLLSMEKCVDHCRQFFNSRCSLVCLCVGNDIRDIESRWTQSF